MFTTGIRAGVFINQEHFAVFQSWQQIFCDILSLLVIIMFIETLEFTIPVDLCDLFSSLKRGPRSNMEFPASVNSYGTTQDANIQVLLRANKLTFKVDGVSSNSSMISKSECKTLKLSVFDVDCNVAAEEELNTYSDIVSQNAQYSNPVKRTREYSVSESPQPPAKSSRNSFSDSSSKSRSIPQQSPRSSNQNQSKSHNDTPVNIKQEPEDPDLIEIEPDDIVPKKETPYMQIDYSSDVPHTQTSQAALERLSHPQSSHSQSPASSSSSFHQNVPHVQDYSEPGPSQSHHGDQSADDFLVFQDDDGDENEADYSNDDCDDKQVGPKEGVSSRRVRGCHRKTVYNAPFPIRLFKHSEKTEFVKEKKKSGKSRKQISSSIDKQITVMNNDGNKTCPNEFVDNSTVRSCEQIGMAISSDKTEVCVTKQKGQASNKDKVSPDMVPDSLTKGVSECSQTIESKFIDGHLIHKCSCGYASCKKAKVRKHVSVSARSHLFKAGVHVENSSSDNTEPSSVCVRRVLRDGRFGLWCSRCNYFTLKSYNMDRHIIRGVHLSKLTLKGTLSTENIPCKQEQMGTTDKMSPDDSSKLPEMTSDDKVLFCTKCPFSCTNKSLLRSHKLSHVSIECKLCKKKFTGNVYLFQHTKFKHPESLKDKSADKTSGNTSDKAVVSLTCEVCSKQFKDKSRLSKHVKFKHPESLGVTDCGMSGNVLNDSDTTLTCGLCSKQLENRNILAKHVLTHVPAIHKCDFCQKQFTKKQCLLKHQVKCLRKPFTCSQEIASNGLQSSSSDGTDSKCIFATQGKAVDVPDTPKENSERIKTMSLLSRKPKSSDEDKFEVENKCDEAITGTARDCTDKVVLTDNQRQTTE